jgi:ABC-type microcin C transport system permease subunit YejE
VDDRSDKGTRLGVLYEIALAAIATAAELSEITEVIWPPIRFRFDMINLKRTFALPAYCAGIAYLSLEKIEPYFSAH